MLPLPPTQVSSLWSAVSWKLGSIIDIATITPCTEWAYTTLWTCFSCPLHPPFSKAMCLLVKTGFRCQLYGWSSGTSADVCPNPPPGIRLHPGDHTFEWLQSSGTRGPVLGPAPAATLALLPESNLSAQCQQLASWLEKQGRCTCCTCASQTCLSPEFHLPCSWVPLVSWGSESQACPSKCGIAPQSAGWETDKAHFVTLSQNSTANLGWTWVLEQIQNCLFGVCGWIFGLFLWLAEEVWGIGVFLINMMQKNLQVFPMKGLQSHSCHSSDTASRSVGLVCTKGFYTKNTALCCSLSPEKGEKSPSLL